MNYKFKTYSTFTKLMEKFTVYHDSRIALIDHLNVEDIENMFPIKTEVLLVLMCLKGNISFLLNNKSYTANSNDMVVCQPQTICQSNTVSPDYKCCGFCLSPEYAKQIFLVSSNNLKTRFFIENHPIIQVNETAQKIFCQYYELLRAKLTEQPHAHQKEVIDALLQAFIFEMHDSLDEAIHKEPNNFRSSTNLFNSFLNLLLTTYPKERSVSYYSEKLFVTSKYLTAVCKSCTGETALGIITKYVVQDIEYLLKCPDKSIKQIANELNFPNLSFFGKYVKRCLGVSPKEYRERILKDSLL